MSRPNNYCGECPAWLSMDSVFSRTNAIDNHCQYCDLFKNQRFVRHIPTQCCYPLNPDGKTVTICGARLDIEVDGKIFWEYVDHYEQKVIVPVDPIEAAKKIWEEKQNAEREKAV